MASRTVTVILAGNSKGATDAIGKVSGALGKVAKPAALAAGALAAATTAIGAKAISNATKLESGLAEVRTLLPQLSDEGFGALRDQVLAFSNEMGIATDDLVPALYQAVSAGVPQDNLFEFLQTATEAAVGGVTDLETSVDGITSVVNAFGSDVISAAEASDVMFTAVKLGKTNFEELSGSINQVAPIAAAMGIEFRQVAAAATTMTQTGVSTSESMTKVRALMQSLTAPTDQARKLFEELGIQVDSNRLANEGFLPVLQEIMGATGGNVDQLKRMFGSVEALQAAMTLTAGDGEAFTAVLGEMENSTNATNTAFNTMADTSAFKWQEAQVRLNNTLTKVGVAILPAVTTALSGVSSALDWLIPRFESLAIGLIEGVGPAFNDHIKPALSAVAGFITGTLLPALKEIASFFADHIIPLIVGELVPTIKAIYETGFQAVVDFWEQTLQPAVQEIMDLFGSEGDSGNETLTGVLNVLQTVFGIVFGAVQLVVETVIGRIINVATLLINTLTGIITFITAVFRGDWELAWQAVQDIALGVWNFLMAEAQRIWDLIAGIFDLFGVDLEQIFAGVWDKIKSGWNSFKSFFTQTIPNGFKQGVNAIIGSLEAIPNAFIDGINNMIRAWNNFSLSTPAVKVAGITVVPAFSWSTPDIATISRVSLPRLARGGIVRATPGGTALIAGEGGRDEAIVPLDDRASGFGQTRDVRIQLDVRVHIESGVVLVDDFIEDLTPKMIEALELAGLRGDVSFAGA